MASELYKATEARRRILAEWRPWAEQHVVAGQPRTRDQALAFFKWLETDRGAVLKSVGIAADADMVHGWLFRNGDVAD